MSAIGNCDNGIQIKLILSFFLAKLLIITIVCYNFKEVRRKTLNYNKDWAERYDLKL